MRDVVLMTDSFSSILWKRQSSNAPVMPMGEGTRCGARKHAPQPFELALRRGNPAKRGGAPGWTGRKLVRLAKLLPDKGLERPLNRDRSLRSEPNGRCSSPNRAVFGEGSGGQFQAAARRGAGCRR